MRKLIFYILLFLMLAWTVLSWSGFYNVMQSHVATGEPANAGTVGTLIFSLLMWCLGVVPLGIFAMLAKPR